QETRCALSGPYRERALHFFRLVGGRQVLAAIDVRESTLPSRPSVRNRRARRPHPGAARQLVGSEFVCRACAIALVPPARTNHQPKKTAAPTILCPDPDFLGFRE